MSAQLISKKGSTLHDLPYNSHDRKCLHAWVINVTPAGLSHCIHRCTFCYAREAVYSDLSDQQKVYANLAELVEQDLRRIDLCPPISISNTTDPCQDVPELRREVTRLVETIMSYGVAFSINTKGNPGFLLDLPGFGAYEPKFVALSIEGPPEVLRLLSPRAPDFASRIGYAANLAAHGVNTAVRLDPVIHHVWRGLYGDQWPRKLEELAEQFAAAGVKHVVSSTGRLDKRRPRWPDGCERQSMFERVRRIVANLSPDLALDLDREHRDPSESNSGYRLRKDLRLAFHHRARDIFERHGMTYASCLELAAHESDSPGIPHCEGFPIPFARKGPDGKFQPIAGCNANCHVACRDNPAPPCGKPSLAKPAPFKLSELKFRNRQSSASLPGRHHR